MKAISITAASLLSLFAAACTDPSAPDDEASQLAAAPTAPPVGRRALTPRATPIDLVAADASAIREVAPGRFQAELGGATATMGAEGVAFEDRPLAMRLRAFGREAAVVTAERPVAELSDCLAEAPAADMECARRLELRRGEVVEWWKPASGGLEQGFDLASRPAGDGKLVFDLSLDGVTSVTKIAAAGDAPSSAAIVDRAGQAWTLDDLIVGIPYWLNTQGGMKAFRF